MKPYLPMAVVGGIVVAGLAALYFITPSFQDPQARLNQEVAEKVAQAQAMLAAYDPVDADLRRLLSEPTTTQEADVPEDGGQLAEHVRRRSELIDEALKHAREAVQTSVDDASGSSHPAATHLEALLLYRKADLQRREGLAHRIRARRATQRVADLLIAWDEVDRQVRTLAARVVGPQTPHARPTAEGTTEPASAPVAPPSQAECTIALDVEAIATRENQTVAQRIADLQQCHAFVSEEITKAQEKARVLQPLVDQLTQRIQAAKARAEAAQKKMAELEHAGIDATDPTSLERFTQEYTQASDEYRRASLEVAILTTGSAPGQPQLSEAEREQLIDPLIELPVDFESEDRGLIALESELRAANGLIETRQKQLELIDKHLARLNDEQKLLRERYERLVASRDQATQAVAAAARQVFVEALAADALEKAALDTLETGRGAARRAQSAARSLGSTPREGYTPDRTTAGYARFLAADMEQLALEVQAQLYAGLNAHAQLLEDLQRTGIKPESLLPEEGDRPEDIAWAINLQGARAAAEDARKKAIEAGTAAIEGYTEAAGDLQNLWILQAQIGACEHLMATITTGPEADKHLAAARKAYDLAIRDRRDRPEAQPYVRILQGLTQAGR